MTKVAVYGRVSTDHEAQQSAFENQMDWYQSELAKHPDWKLVQVYSDKGITGTSAEKRPGFMQMMADAEKGKFDLIVTREVSRFARNTVDTLSYTRELRNWGVYVYFISENILTDIEDGELRLSLMATIAQEESRKTSMRVKKGQEVSRNKGVYYGSGNILGYTRVETKKANEDKKVEYIIDPEQAQTVRKIFDLYLEGKGLRAIQLELERLGYKTATGNSNWHMANISRVLRNCFYTGMIEYGKQYVPNFLEQKKINNLGERPTMTVQGTHQPLVSVEDFNRVQERFQQNRRIVDAEEGEHKQRVFGQRPPIDVWVKLLHCSCGHAFNRKVWHKGTAHVEYAYQCYNQVRTGSKKTRQNHGLDDSMVCEAPMLPEWKLQMMASRIFFDYLKDTKAILAMTESILKETSEEDDREAEIIEIRKGLTSAEKEQDKLLDLYLKSVITEEIFTKKNAALEQRKKTLTEQLEELEVDEEEIDIADYKYKMTILKAALDSLTNDSEPKEISEEIIDAFISKIVVYPDRLDWYLRFSPDPEKPIGCNVTGSKRRGDTPSFAYCNTGSH